MSGIVFAGCSFTHGHGLWFYCNDLYQQYKNEQIVGTIIKDRPIHHLKYKDVIRFPRLVSQELEMFEITRQDYSGNDEDSIEFIDHVFDFYSLKPQWLKEHYKYDEVKYIIFQTSMPERCHYTTTDKFKFRFSDNLDIIDELFKKYDIVDYESYELELCNQIFNRIKKTFIHYESKGIKPLIFNWSNHYNKLIENDDYMSQRKIFIKYKNIEFKSLKDIFDFDENLTIYKDYEFFGKNTPIDYHPSKKFHKIIADSIIEKIKSI